MKAMDEKHVVRGPKPLHHVEEGTVGQLLHRALSKHSHLSQALINAHTGQQISYKELLEATCRLAQSLQNYGVAQNSVISICSENNLYVLDPLISALYLGIIVAPINANYSEKEFHHVLNISRPQLIFCSKKSLNKVKALQKKLPFIQKLILLDAESDLNGVDSLQTFVSQNSDADTTLFKPVSFDRNEQVALILCSSGTTGLSKGVMLTHNNMMIHFAHCRDPRVGTAMPPVLTVLTFLPLFHNFGIMTTLGFLAKGIRVVLMQRFQPELFLQSVQKYRVESVLLVPPLLLFLAKSPLVDQFDISSLKEVGCGAAPLAKEVGELVIKRLGLKGIRQGYAMTETTSAVLFTAPDDFRPGSAGKVVSLVSAKVVEPETLKPLGPNQTGELWFKSELTMKGYIGNAEATRNTITEDGWLRTGDLAYYDEDGFFFVVDRLKEVIKYKGFQVSPAELEALLLEHPSIKDAAVVGLPDEEAGELPLAFVTLQPGKKLTEQEVADFVAGQVSSTHQLQGGVRFVDEIPKSVTGKILRKNLRELVRNQKSKL